MSDRLVLYETQVVPLGSTSLHSRANSKLDRLPLDWEVIQVIDAAKWMKVLPGDEKLMALVRRVLPHPAPPMLITDGAAVVETAGWFQDPVDDGVERYFDGEFWTVHIRIDSAWSSARETAVSSLDEQQSEYERYQDELAMADVFEVVAVPGESSAGWYRDPSGNEPGVTHYRYFDGTEMTHMAMTMDSY